MRKWFIFSLSVFLLLGCDPESKTKAEICNDGIDNDGDGHVDCADPGCYGQAGGPTGQLCQSTESRCDDAFDNDADGETDCDDPDCAASCGGVEDCDNDVDDDGDGDIDCDDADCDEDPACTGGEICDNDQDDDGDGDVDCDDEDCAGAANCQPVEDCDDGIDNDGDTLADCADSDCLGQQGAGGLCQATEAACADNFDNDADGDTDCADDDCSADPACLGPVEDCDVAGDEDGDGLADCLDPECNNQTGPGGGTCQTVESSCADNYDNDGDGLTDCADSDCSAECLTTGALVITEIMKDPNLVLDNVGEWFEVHNTTAGAIDLAGLVIYSAASGGEETHVIATSMVVPAGGYAVLGLSADPVLNGGVTVHYVYTGIAFNNTTDDHVGLRTAGGTVIDAVLFPAASFPTHAGWAMQLDAGNLTAVANDSAANWCSSRVEYNGFDTGTPGVENHLCAVETACADSADNDGDGTTDCADFACANAANCSTAAVPVAGSLIVTEIMANPGIGTPNYQHEWFEVLNTTAGAVELNGLTICDDTPTRYCFRVHFGVSTPLAAGARALFVSDDSLWTGHTGILFEYGPAIQLATAADAVQIFHGATLIDAVAYDNTWPFATAGAAVQYSSSADQTAAANDLLADWCLALAEYDTVNHLYGTPGAANRDCHLAETVCNDNTDNDGDGLIDCADPNCVGQTGASGETCQATESTCDDGFDNDRDGLTDCADPNCAGLPGPGGANCPSGSMTIFFSEYIEGSSNNKAVEIFNPFSTPFDLTGCVVNTYSNGSNTPNYSLTLTATIAAGDVYVICNASANASIQAACDVQSTITYFNGDDAVDLVCGGVTLDVIGQIGNDPGTEWGTGDTSTAENTIRRKCGITNGDAVGSDAFDPAVEWNGFPQDDSTGLGSHTVTCK